PRCVPNDKRGNLTREAFWSAGACSRFRDRPPTQHVHPFVRTHHSYWTLDLEFLWILVLVSLNRPRRKALVPDDRRGNLTRETFWSAGACSRFRNRPPTQHVHPFVRTCHSYWILDLEFLWILVLVGLDLPRRKAPVPDDQRGNLTREAFGVRELAPAFGTARPPSTFIHLSEPVIHIEFWNLDFLWILVLVSLDFPRRKALVPDDQCGNLTREAFGVRELAPAFGTAHPPGTFIHLSEPVIHIGSWILEFLWILVLVSLDLPRRKALVPLAEAPRPPINPFSWEFRAKLPRHPGRSETTLKHLEAFRRILKLFERSCKAVPFVPFVPSLSSPLRPLRERLD